MCRRILLAVVLSTFFSAPSFAQRLSPEDLSFLMQEIVAFCRGGTLSGKNQSLTLEGDADASVTILSRRVAGLGLDGTAKFSETEWIGIEPMKEYDPERYDRCLEMMSERLIPNKQSALDADFGQVKVVTGQSFTACDPDSHIHSSVMADTPRRPLQQIILSGVDLEGGSTRLEIGPPIVTRIGCEIALVRTGRDADFYAVISRRPSTE